MGIVIENVNWKTRTFEPLRQVVETPQRQLAAYETTAPKPFKKENKKPEIFEVLPWQKLPEGYMDYRPLLQRDGLILYAWELYNEKIRIIWLTSASRIMRKYQAEVDNEKDMQTLTPDSKFDTDHWNHKPKPNFIIYVAPEHLTRDTRNAFITKLKEEGSTVNFKYEFSLGRQKAERERAVFNKIKNRQTERALNSGENKIRHNSAD